MSAARFASSIIILPLLALVSCDGDGPSVPFRAPMEGKVEGVVTVEGAALAGVSVALAGGKPRTALTDEAGTYAFPWLPAGDYLVWISGYSEDAEFEPTSKPVSLSSGRTVARVDFEGAWKREATVQGTVTVEGRGIEGMTVSLSGPEAPSAAAASSPQVRAAATDREGGFSFTELQPGRYAVTLSGFDAAVHAFADAEQSVTAVNGEVAEVRFSGTLVPRIPMGPSDLTAAAGGPTTMNLSWTDGSDNEAEFRLERKGGGGGESWSPIGAVGADETSFSDSELAPDTYYSYRVRACNHVGCSEPSAEASAKTDEVPPAAPSHLAATPTGASTTDLTWADESENETEFRVERKRGVTGTWSPVTAVGADVTQYSDMDLLPNTVYVYRLRACNDAGCSGYSNEASALTSPRIPAAPVDLAAASTGPTSVDLSWQDQSLNETRFQVDRRVEAGGSWGQIGVTGSNVTGYADSGLSPSTTYLYRVRACNSEGCSLSSNEASATTGAVAGPNLSIPAMYITQSAQDLGGGVPLVQGRAGYLRVFALASESNDWRPSVRVGFYQGGALVHSEVISAPGSSVPLSVNEASLESSWNMRVPWSLIQPGISILAEVDPDDEVAESVETDNAFPASGSPRALDVRVPPAFNVMFVPVRQSVNNRAGNVTSGNAGEFLEVTLRMLPVTQASPDVHAEFVTNAPALESDNANGAWGTILGEISALRVAEGSSRYYYGVVRTTYSSGVAGMGYQGWPAAIGWDYLPSGSSIAAHEWGHNWSLRHAPGCGAGNPDGSFPYSDGKIGIWGMDVGTEALKSPSTFFDFMSYCGPEWISDYHYQSVLLARQASGGYAAPGAEEPSLLIWGRIQSGRVILEPALEVTTVPTLPTGPGEYTIEGSGYDEETLFSFDFQPIPVPDGRPGEGHFAFAVPLRSFPMARLARIRVSAGGAVWTSREGREGPGSMERPEPRLRPLEGTRAELTWDGNAFPMAMVRDPCTGEILSFARDGRIRLSLLSPGLEVVFSDGVHSSEVVRMPFR